MKTKIAHPTHKITGLDLAYAKKIARRHLTDDNSNLPVEIVDGDAAPQWRGHSFCWETPSGVPVRHPNAYRRAFGKPVYVSSTLRVEVGIGWLVARGA